MNEIQKKYIAYKNIIDNKIISFIEKTTPESLYQPIKYILAGGGKRIRPVLLMFACEAVGGNPENAIDAALAVEILHNFTLIHDDIMDNASFRRGRETIHKKWNENIAILAGDNMVGLAFQSLLETKSQRIQEIAKEFTKGIIEVCEGQSYDKEFEARKDVTIEEYIFMINKKTSKLLEVCTGIGALIGNADDKKYSALKNYALNLGIAFQIQDDLLDISGDEKKFGKKIGGDIIEGKKTYLLLNALNMVNKEPDKKIILEIIENNGLKTYNKDIIDNIRRIYNEYGVVRVSQIEIKKYTKEAEKYLDVLETPDSKEILKWFSRMLLGRSF